VGEAPGAVGVLAIGQVLQVVLDVLAGGSVFRSHSDQFFNKWVLDEGASRIHSKPTSATLTG
jgi:hypothetical protein